jgi:hypothetical protein
MIQRLFLSGLLLLLPALAMAQSPRLIGIAPSIAGPGKTVIVTGGPFTPEVRVVFGDRLLAPSRIGERQLTFVVPQMPPGEYLLQLQTGEETSDRSLFFRIVLPQPAIHSLEPHQIDTCDLGRGLQVVVRGEDFQPGTLLLLDGAILASGRTAEDALTFAVPDLTPGLHQIQLANPDGQRSLPAALLIDSTPEIESVTTGEEAVTYYQLVISGRNFSYRTNLLVDGQQITPFSPGALADDSQQVIPYNLNPLGTDSLQYVDCRTLIYVRHPYSTQPKSLILQIINPDGKASGAYPFTGP